jgi:hypothetical protein
MTFEKVGTNGWCRHERERELTIKRASVPGGAIYRIEDEVDLPSGRGGVVRVIQPAYVFVAEPVLPF